MKKSIFSAKDGVPFPFAIEITEEQDGCMFQVVQCDAPVNEIKRGKYHLKSALHASYLDLFEQLHADFGFPMPQNRRPYVRPIFEANYKELLVKNIDKGMLYGYGDPSVLLVKEDKPCYYVVSTSNDAADAFPIVKSENLTDWEFVSYVFPQGHQPQWAMDGEGSDFWAPEMHKVGCEYRLYFVARDKVKRELCIGLARSASPKGPFVPEPQPILNGNVIDPHLLILDEKTSYLFWKEDNNDVWPGLLIDLIWQCPALIAELFTEESDRALASFIVTLKPWLQQLAPMERFLFTQVFIESVTTRYSVVYHLLNEMAAFRPELTQQIKTLSQYMKTPMYARELTIEGNDFKGDKIKILENDLDWEAHLVEGMWVQQLNNKYYLFYAGNDFSTDQYGIGVAISDSVLGPYQKMKAPILTSSAKWLAPGHPSVTTAPNGKPLLFLHAFFPGKAGYKQFRALLALELEIGEEGVAVGR
jgi:arabinan endo-1,5-alpha-L-arabinosidase